MRAPGTLTVDDLGAVHLIGAGGAGMSAVAALLVARGVAVSGSDATAGPALEALAARGVRVRVGHAVDGVDGVDTVVVSSAIRPDNPELVRARARGLRVLHRSEALAALMADRRTVAVAGAHGKTTTSAMVGVCLLAAGTDPSWVVGGSVRADAGLGVETGPLAGARHGAEDVLVAEADESDGSFLAYRPHVALVTNVEPDHLDHYGSRDAFERAFVDFAAGVVAGGHLVTCADDAGARRLAEAARAAGTSVVAYGRADDADVRVGPWEPTDRGGRAVLTVAGRTDVLPLGAVARLDLAVPGDHNVLNAAGAWTAACLLGVDPGAAADGLARFRGTGRRFEEKGTAAGVAVVDDYAHHPTEVAALLAAARPVAGQGRVLVLFQPHLFSRTRTFADAFAAALAAADVVVVTDVYAAREDPDPTVTGALLTDGLQRLGHPAASFVPDREAAARTVAAAARPGDLVLTVGAGDVGALGPVVLDALGTSGSERGATPDGEPGEGEP